MTTKTEKAQEIISLAGITSSFEKELNVSLQSILDSPPPGATLDDIEEVRTYVENLIASQKSYMDNIFVSIYSKEFNDQELDHLVGYYRTEMGRQIQRKIPAVNTQIFNRFYDYSQRVLVPEIIKKLDAKADEIAKRQKAEKSDGS